MWETLGEGCGKVKVICVLNQAPRREEVCEEWKLHIFWTSVLYGAEWSAPPPGKSPRYSLYRRLGGPQSQSGRSGEEKKSHGNGPSGSLKGGKYLDRMSEYQLVKKDPVHGVTD